MKKSKLTYILVGILFLLAVCAVIIQITENNRATQALPQVFDGMTPEMAAKFSHFQERTLYAQQKMVTTEEIAKVVLCSDNESKLFDYILYAGKGSTEQDLNIFDNGFTYIGSIIATQQAGRYAPIPLTDQKIQSVTFTRPAEVGASYPFGDEPGIIGDPGEGQPILISIPSKPRSQIIFAAS